MPNTTQAQPTAPRRPDGDEHDRRRPPALARLVRDDVGRGRFLKMLGAGGAATVGSALIAACGSSENEKKPSTATSTTATSSAGEDPFGAGDMGILNYALTLEYLETDFYRKVGEAKLFNGKTASLLEMFGHQEHEHVEALRTAIIGAGGKPVSEPKFKFPLESASQVGMLAYTVENLGAAAYLGQVTRIQSKKVLEAALSIHSVEGRHAAVLGTVVHKSVTPDGAFAKPADMPTVLAAVKPFIVSGVAMKE